MLGFSQIIRPRASVAASAPGDGGADGHDRPATGRRQAYLRMGHPASPMTIRIARDIVGRRLRLKPDPGPSQEGDG